MAKNRCNTCTLMMPRVSYIMFLRTPWFLHKAVWNCQRGSFGHPALPPPPSQIS